MSEKPLHPEQAKEEVSEFIAKGLTTDPDEDREMVEKASGPDGAEQLRQVQQIEYLPGTRVPIPKFVATVDDDTAWMDGVHDDRLMRGVVVSFPQEVVDAMRAGHICIRCYEPHAEAFPVACKLCGFNMREMQSVAFAAEFEGITHVGPSKPLQAFADERENERLMKEHAKKMDEGASPMKGLRGKKD